jgi:hypothetical protein
MQAAEPALDDLTGNPHLGGNLRMVQALSLKLKDSRVSINVGV